MRTGSRSDHQDQQKVEVEEERWGEGGERGKGLKYPQEWFGRV